MHTGVNRGRMLFSSLGEALQPNYNSVAKCRQKGRTPQVVSNLQQSPCCLSTTDVLFGR
jgi:hypothetical protein